MPHFAGMSAFQERSQDDERAHVRNRDQRQGQNPEEARLRLPGARELFCSSPGIVSGYWLEPIEGIGTSVLVFETKEYAEEAAKYPVPPMPGVTLLDLIVREVFAHV